MKRFLIIAWLVACVAAHVVAQNATRHFQQANTAFETGHFEQVDSLLANYVDLLHSDIRIKAYRLLALSNLFTDNAEQAEKYTGKLLQIDPYYTAYGDHPRFIDMIERMKKGKKTLTTASNLAETEEEAPIPVTLITEEMIKASGATKLADVLSVYVPGFSSVASVNDNMAMRGVYAMGQETMLVMLDGHRMNSIATNGESFDCRYSIDKIQQIEVLRAPASSLYGNVALTAVVNIITKNGNETDGSKISLRAGKFDTYSVSAIHGNGNLQSDFLVWGSAFNSKGEPHNVHGTTHYIGGYNHKPTIDIGLKQRWGDFKISAMGVHSHMVPYYSLLTVNDRFTYDSYMTDNGNKPGFSRTNIRVDLDYSHTWDNFVLSASAFGNLERCQIYNVLSDTIQAETAAALSSMLGTEIPTRGSFQVINWNAYSTGGMATGTINYKGQGHGSWLMGIQYENLIPSDAEAKIGKNYNLIQEVINDIIYPDLEHTISVFSQLKHHFSQKLIFNGGLRYDHKIRFDKRRLNTWSPRVSLIWLPTSVMSVKMGYSHAFVDAPAFYRSSKIALFSGGADLNPETMDAFYLNTTFNWKPLHLKYDVNLFYNNVKDLVYRRVIFVNAGKISMGGIENTLQYTTNNTLVNLNCTYQHPFNVEDFYATDKHNLCNVPDLLFNITAARRVSNHKKSGSFWLRANMHSQTGMDCVKSPETMDTYYQSGYTVVGAGIEWESTFGLALGLDASNLFDRDYTAGGQLLNGIPGMGTMVMGKVSIDF